MARRKKDERKVTSLSGPIVHRDRAQQRRSNGAAKANGETKLGRCERALLTVLVQREGERTTAVQLAILSGYSHTSSGFANALGALRSSGLAQGPGDDIRVTGAGLSTLEHVTPLATGRALLTYWCGKLGKCERVLLETLACETGAMTKEELAEVSGYSVTSSGFANALGKLRTLQLAHGGGEAIRISEELIG